MFLKGKIFRKIWISLFINVQHKYKYHIKSQKHIKIKSHWDQEVNLSLLNICSLKDNDNNELDPELVLIWS